MSKCLRSLIVGMRHQLEAGALFTLALMNMGEAA
jgi:hypothetical protein